MINNLFTLILCLLSYSAVSQGADFEWAYKAGSSGDDQGRSVSVDAVGNVYTTGYFTGTVDFDPGVMIYNLSSNGGADIFIQKVAADGSFLWAIKIGGTLNDRGWGIVSTASGTTYITGFFQGTVDFNPGPGVLNLTASGSNDIFVLNLDSNGNIGWVRVTGGTSNDQARAITIDPSGNVYLTGLFTGTVDFDPGPANTNLSSNGATDVFIQKFDAFGTFLWAKSFGGFGVERGYSVSTDGFGNVYTTGFYIATVDFNPGPGTFLLTGIGGANALFVEKLDPSGNFIWANTVKGSNDIEGNSLQADAAGNVCLTGRFWGTVDFDSGPSIFNLTASSGSDIFIYKIDANGDFLWAISEGGGSTDAGNSIDIDLVGNIYVTGTFLGAIVDFDPGPGVSNLSSIGLQDVFIQKLDMNGNFEWAYSIGGDFQNDLGISIYVDQYTSVHTIGYFKASSVDFDPGLGVFNMSTSGSNDSFVQKMSQCLVTAATDIKLECETYTWIDGNTYTSSNNTATYTLMNVAGCDSLVNLDLTILNSSSSTDVKTECDSYTWIDGNAYTASNNTATFTIMNAAGCDSLVTLDLTILNSNSGTDPQTACNSYTWIDGNTYTANNNSATFTLVNTSGCDSIVTLDLTINTVDVTTSVVEPTITANNSGVTYQWLDCDNNYSIISGETNQIFTATVIGNYAVQIIENGCTDTSACVSVNVEDVFENTFGMQIVVFPNPTTEHVYVDLGRKYSKVDVRVTNVLGEIMLIDSFFNSSHFQLSIEGSAGVYFMEIVSEKGDVLVVKVLKRR